jgi:hypothetical protein
MMNPGSPSVQGIFGESGFSIGLCRDFLGAELLELPSHHLRESDSFVLGRVPCLSFERLGKFDAEEGITSGRIGTLHDPIGHSWQKYETPLTCSRGSPLRVASVSM